jgi:hypothetical protein
MAVFAEGQLPDDEKEAFDVATTEMIAEIAVQKASRAASRTCNSFCNSCSRSVRVTGWMPSGGQVYLNVLRRVAAKHVPQRVDIQHRPSSK